MEPKRLPVGFSGDGGITSATGSPKRVTRIGLRVLRTSSSMPRHLALNSEMATSFMSTYTMVNDYSQTFNRQNRNGLCMKVKGQGQVHNNAAGRSAASANTWHTRERITITPACAWPARKKFWRS